MREFLSFQFPAISKEEELTTLQKARAIAQYMREDTPHEHIPFLQQEGNMKVKTTPEILKAFADLSKLHEWNPKKQKLYLILANSAYIKIKPWGESLVTIATKNFVYDASDLRELAEELTQLASMMEKNND